MADISVPDLLGSAAGLLTTVAFLPQVIKTWRSRSAKDISLAMFVIFTAGVVLWLAYGLVLDAWPIIIANAVTLVFAGLIIGMKLRETAGKH